MVVVSYRIILIVKFSISARLYSTVVTQDSTFYPVTFRIWATLVRRMVTVTSSGLTVQMPRFGGSGGSGGSSDMSQLWNKSLERVVGLSCGVLWLPPGTLLRRPSNSPTCILRVPTWYSGAPDTANTPTAGVGAVYGVGAASFPVLGRS